MFGTGAIYAEMATRARRHLMLPPYWKQFQVKIFLQRTLNLQWQHRCGVRETTNPPLCTTQDHVADVVDLLLRDSLYLNYSRPFPSLQHPL